MKPEEIDAPYVERELTGTVHRFQRLLPAHKAGLTLYHNEHLSVYETVAERLSDLDDQGPDWVSEEEKERAKATNEMWELHWYPNTPVGFNHVAASSLAALLAYVAQMERA